MKKKDYGEIMTLISDIFRNKAKNHLVESVKSSLTEYISDPVYGKPDITVEDALVFLIVNDLLTYLSVVKNQVIIGLDRYQGISAIIRSLERELKLEPLPEEITGLYSLIESENTLVFRNIMSSLESFITNDISTDDNDLGGTMQSLLPFKTRKKLAANYTFRDITLFLAQLLDRDTGCRIIDPFAGSGRLLTAILPGLLRKHGKEFVIRGIELFPLSARLAKCQIAITLAKIHAVNHLTRVVLTKGDAFQELNESSNKPIMEFFKDDKKREKSIKYDLVIMNPPYTRYNLLPRFYRDFLEKRFVNYGDYFGKHAGLHIYAMFLADEHLASNGRLVAVLPASILYSKYTEKFKPFL
ncbi:MAG: Eco57I restriction-modification methylase domain-containing protein, partial [Candidatus Hodarchaeales archaeon]